ncbi:hypothetical protein CCMA1212_001840 [Trichoderma ghanense]|uniref:Uncharacterized protein n=1 Tax=Trichoderma ghanense TaxID=65468 RepID=A0ABY2HDY4_9HYPO
MLRCWSGTWERRAAASRLSRLFLQLSTRLADGAALSDRGLGTVFPVCQFQVLVDWMDAPLLHRFASEASPGLTSYSGLEALSSRSAVPPAVQSLLRPPPCPQAAEAPPDA